MNQLSKYVFKYSLIFLLLLANFYILKRIGLFEIIFFNKGKFLDFDNYHRMIRGMFNGQHPYRDQLGYTQTLGPPLVLAVYLPFSVFSLTTARLLMTLTSLFSAFLMCQLLAKDLFKQQKLLVSLLLCLLLFSSFPARFNLLMGQPNLIIALLLTIFLTTKKACLKGGCLALAAVIKTFLGLSIFSLLKKNKKSLFWFFIILALIIFLSFPLIKPLYYSDFIKERFLRITFLPTRPNNLDYYNQSIKSTLFRFGIGELYSFLYPALFILGGAYLFLTGNLEAGIILALLFSPVCWQHYFVILFPLMIRAFRKIFPQPKFLGLLGLSFFIFWTEIPWLHQAKVNFINAILASHYFFSALILLFLVKSRQRR